MLKVMSFNIRCANAQDGENNWEHRRQLVIDRIRAFDPDLLGMQECRSDAQAEFIQQSLPEYEFFGRERGGPEETAVEMTPLLFKRDRFEEIESGAFWLSDTPEVPGSISWGAAFPRTSIWVRLCIKSDPDRQVIFLNTHFDYVETVPEPSAVTLRKWLKKNFPSLPVILTGDFNSERGSAAHRILTDFDGLIDPFTSNPNLEKSGSYHDFGKITQPWCIDWVLTSSKFSTRQVNVDTNHQHPLYPSDHFPITVVLDLN